MRLVPMGNVTINIVPCPLLFDAAAVLKEESAALEVA
jgi:hypothetical protein